MKLSFKRLILVFAVLLVSADANARLEICNQTDLVLMVVVGYNTDVDRIATEGWWRVYPGTCEVPVDVSLLKGSYFVHAESNPRSTMPDDSFNWGEEKPLCVKLADFRLPNGSQCKDGDIAISFNEVKKNWRNTNVVNIYHSTRRYENQFRTKIAGVQRLLSVLGYDVGVIDGVIGGKTVDALNQVGIKHGIWGFDFNKVFSALEKEIAVTQKLDS